VQTGNGADISGFFLLSGGIMDNQKPSYYGIITAAVRYDERLTPFAKLMMAEITALTSFNGVCWATNNYFAELYGCSKKTISRSLSQLAECGHIKMVLVKDPVTNEVLSRNITLSESLIPMDKNIQTPPEENVLPPMDKKVKDNNTRVINNTRKNNIGTFQKPTVDEIEYYAKGQNLSIDPNRFYDYYESKGWMVGKNKMKCWKSAVRNWCRNQSGWNGEPKKPDKPKTIKWFNRETGRMEERNAE